MLLLRLSSCVLCRFKLERGVTGHTTVIWSASVERPCLAEFETAEQLLTAIDRNDPEVSPSLLYACAAALEGCSFVNGGSQNTLCPGLVQLADRLGAYVLGTDFKAGQTKFKTAAVEYIRALGLQPTVIASSNHLGNNDMLNLTSKKTLDAKMRVKSDIFAGWEENIDHQVREEGRQAGTEAHSLTRKAGTAGLLQDWLFADNGWWWVGARCV